MGLETGTYNNDLVDTNPLGSDPKSAGDDHLRLVKATNKNTFPGFTGAVMVGGVFSGTAAAHVLTPVRPLLSYTAQTMFVYVPTLAGTGACTVNVSGLGAKNIKTILGADPTAGDIVANQPLLMYYDGTNMILLGGSAYLARTGNQTMTGNLTMVGTQAVTGDLSVTGNLTGPSMTAKGNVAGQAWTGTQDFTGATTTVATQSVGDSSTKAASTAFVAATAFSAALPGQTGNAGKYLTTNGSAASWAALDTGGAIQIGSMIPMNQSADIVTIGTTDYQRSGVLAASGYTSAPLVSLFIDSDNLMPASGTWSGCAFGNGIAIVVSSASATGARSLDNGLTWQSITLPASCTGIAYGGGQFIATASASANVYTSPNGVTWATNALPAVALGPILFANNLWVAINSSGTAAASSTDGITWTARTVPSGTYRSIAYGNGTYFAADASLASNTGCSSTNGTTWTARSSPVNRTWSSVTYSTIAGLFVASNISANTDYVTSPDGITWTARTWPTSAARYAVVSTGNLIAAFTGTTTYHTSPDGINWTARTLTGAATYNSTHTSNLCAVGDGGYIYPTTGAAIAKTIVAASGRGHQRAEFANPIERSLPFYMRMN